MGLDRRIADPQLVRASQDHPTPVTVGCVSPRFGAWLGLILWGRFPGMTGFERPAEPCLGAANLSPKL